MKKKMLLFGIILLSSFGLMGNVGAEEFVDFAKLDIAETFKDIKLDGMGRANFYYMHLTDESSNKRMLALCLDHGLSARSSYKYIEQDVVVHAGYKAAYTFAIKYPTKVNTLMMQAILWRIVDEGSTSFIRSTAFYRRVYVNNMWHNLDKLHYYIYNAYLSIYGEGYETGAYTYSNTIGDMFREFFNNTANYSSTKLYMYKTNAPGSQRLITGFKLDGVNSGDGSERYLCLPVTGNTPIDITMDVVNCINTGRPAEECLNEVISRKPECKNEIPYYCTSPTTGEQIEITTCVNNLVNTGVSVDSAVSQCTAQTPACQPRCKIDASLNHAVCDSSDTKNLNYSTKGNCLDNYTGEVVDGKRINKAGILAGDMGGYCRIYCSENLTEVFPGSINKAVNPGAYVIWPSIESNMSIASTRTCKVYVKEDAQTQYDAKQDDYTNYYNRHKNDNDYSASAMNEAINKGNCDIPQSKFNDAKSKWEAGHKECDKTYECGGINEETNLYESKTCKHDDDVCSHKTGSESCDAIDSEYSKREVALENCEEMLNKYNAMQAVVNTLNACLNDNLSSYKKFSPKGTITYTDECNNSSDTNYSGTFNLTPNTSQYCNGRCSSLTAVNSPSRQLASARANKDAFANGISRIKGNAEMTVTSNTTFSLSHSDGNYYYQYISKDTTYPEYKNQKNGLTNYVDLKKSVLPVCNSSSIGTHSGALSASITDIGYKWNSSNQTVSGSQYTFGNNNSYVCSYKVNNVNECICPSGTVHEFEPVPCPVDPSDSDSCATQKEKLCDEWNWDEEGDFCNATDCTLTSNSLKVCVIYRTISLENPFPGKSGNNSVSGISLTNSLSRKPGSNWNDKNLIKAQITNARESSGNDIYKKEPLYRFVLTGDILKEIRKYNDTRESHGGYADYTLTCKNGLNGTSRTSACISNFVHTPRISGLTDGTCSSLSISSSAQNFYKCSGDV